LHYTLPSLLQPRLHPFLATTRHYTPPCYNWRYTLPRYNSALPATTLLLQPRSPCYYTPAAPCLLQLRSPCYYTSGYLSLLQLRSPCHSLATNTLPCDNPALLATTTLLLCSACYNSALPATTLLATLSLLPSPCYNSASPLPLHPPCYNLHYTPPRYNLPLHFFLATTRHCLQLRSPCYLHSCCALLATTPLSPCHYALPCYNLPLRPSLPQLATTLFLATTPLSLPLHPSLLPLATYLHSAVLCLLQLRSLPATTLFLATTLPLHPSLPQLATTPFLAATCHYTLPCYNSALTLATLSLLLHPCCPLLATTPLLPSPCYYTLAALSLPTTPLLPSPCYYNPCCPPLLATTLLLPSPCHYTLVYNSVLPATAPLLPPTSPHHLPSQLVVLVVVRFVRNKRVEVARTEW